MTLTTETLLKKFNKFNEEFFNSELPVINIVLTREKRRFGFFEYLRKYDASLSKIVEMPIKIGISTYFDLPEQYVDETLIHEMIHYYISYKHIKDNNQHGRYFMMYANRISAISNYNITTHGSSNGLIPKHTNVNKEYFIATFKYRGSEYFSRISKSRVGTADKMIEDFKGLTDVKFYSTKDLKMDKYRQCTGTLSLNDMHHLNGIELIKL